MFWRDPTLFEVTSLTTREGREQDKKRQSTREAFEPFQVLRSMSTPPSSFPPVPKSARLRSRRPSSPPPASSPPSISTPSPPRRPNPRSPAPSRGPSKPNRPGGGGGGGRRRCGGDWCGWEDDYWEEGPVPFFPVPVPVFPVGGGYNDPYPQWDARRRTTIVVAPPSPPPFVPPTAPALPKAEEPAGGGGDGEDKGRVHGDRSTGSGNMSKTNIVLMWTAIGVGVFLAIVLAVYGGIWLSRRGGRNDGSRQNAGDGTREDTPTRNYRNRESAQSSSSGSLEALASSS